MKLSVLGTFATRLPKSCQIHINGKSKPGEPFVAEECAHQFHESVLQSTQKALQKHKGNQPATGPVSPVTVLGDTGHLHGDGTS